VLSHDNMTRFPFPCYFAYMDICRRGFFVLLALAAFCVSRADASIYYLTTGQSGAQPSIDSADETAWYSPTLGPVSESGIAFVETAVSAFDPTADWLFGGGNFDMKAGSGIPYAGNDGNDPLLTLTIYDGGTDPVDIVDSVSWTATQFCNFKIGVGDGCGQFSVNAANDIPMYFTDDGTATGNLTPFQMLAGHNYTVILSSPALTNGANQYFIKAPTTFVVADANNAPPPTETTPEPSTWLSMLGALVICGFLRIRGTNRRTSL
jgi:hypothetical protein